MNEPLRAGRDEDPGPSSPDIAAVGKRAPAAKRAPRAAKADPLAAKHDPLAAPGVPLPALPAYGLAFLTGVLYFVAFPGIDVWPLAFVALVPLIVALRGQSPRRAAGLGWLAGFTMTMIGFYWLLGMLQLFSGFPTPLCVLFMAILCGYQAGRIALCGFLYGRAERRGWPAPTVFALAFVASELVFPLLFPWYYAAAVHNAPIFLQAADLGGPYLVALVLIAPNLALAEVILARREGRPYDRRLGLVAAATLALALVYGFARIRGTDARAAAELQLFAGRTIDVPSMFIAGKSDWGTHQNPGAFERMQSSACTRMSACHLVDGAGPWVQQEQAEATSRLLQGFLAGRR